MEANWTAALIRHSSLAWGRGFALSSAAPEALRFAPCSVQTAAETTFPGRSSRYLERPSFASAKLTRPVSTARTAAR